MRDFVLPRKGERLLPALSALLLVLSFPPLHLLVPPFVALVPFALWVHGLPPGRDGRSSAVRGGAFLGVLSFGVLLYWILIALVAFTTFALFGYLAVLGLLVVLAALAGWGLHRLVHGAGVRLWLAVPLAWTATEWLQGHLGDLSFPWLGLGTSLTGFPELVGIAELVGARGVTFWIALANGLLATVILHRRVERRWSGAAPALALVVLLPMAWGIWRAGALETRPVGEIAVVQPNIPPDVKFDRALATDSTLRALETLMPRLDGRASLVVWPEVALPEVVRSPDQEALRERVRAMAAAAGSDLLFGGYGTTAAALQPGGAGDPGAAVFNSAFIMTPDGLSGYEYSKRNLVPVIERVPFVDAPRFGSGFYGTLGRGEVREPGRAGGIAFGILICYESIFADASRDFRLAGAEVLVNITNDAWYGREVWYGRTTALWQHPAHMVMRAIENRVGVARAANTGISLFVDPVGRVHDRTPLSRPAVSQAVVRTTDTVTLFTRVGDVTGTAAAASTFLLLLLSGWQGRRARGASNARTG